MPIKVVITLFVCVVVGGVIILFSQRMITKGEQNIQGIGKTPDGVEIVKLSPSAQAADVRKLAEACDALKRDVMRQDCFVIRDVPAAILGDIAALDGTALPGGHTIKVTAGGTPTVLFLAYDPHGYVEIAE